MKMRQEQVVFAVAVVALGAMGYGLFTGGPTALRGGGRPSAEVERPRFRAPDPAIAAPSSAVPPLARELFSPPRDTSALPPLELVEPPRERLAPLLPPTEPGPLPAAYGKLLRRALPAVDLPDLFAEREAIGEDADDEFFDDAAGGGAKRSLVPDADGASDAPDERDPLADLTPGERTAMIAGFKRRYDWIQRGPGETWFGRIVNAERYGLDVDPARANEALEFVRLDPESGREFYANVGAPPIPVERASIAAFGFAETVANEIEVRARRIAQPLTRGGYDESLALARYCVQHRLDSPRALAIAEELYRRAAEYDPKDPLPRIGLARCLEAAFRFDDAFGVYQELLGQFGHREEVHVALAVLETRFLMYEQAEKRLREALSMNQGSWIGRLGLGRFLVARGRAAEAVEHLKVANQNAPQAPELLGVRVEIRTTLGDAHLALGELAEAEAAYRSAVSADARHQRARAGLLSAQVLAGKTADSADDVEGSGFELLLARGVAALAAGQHEASRDALRLAAESDPLRAHLALAAMSVLAEVTGNGEEAARLADDALERDPTNAFASFQKGRLLGLADDYEGARAALLAALEQELDFEDALVALGDMAFRLGRFDDAERYLERAASIGARPEVHALRGLNLLRLGSAGAARESFERALELSKDDPTANAGLAWCLYLDGDSQEALIRLADIDERRRNLPAEDPWRVWSKAQMTRLQEHLRKVEWRDGFERKRLANQWQTNESDGPTVSVDGGAVEIAGAFQKDGRARVYRQYDGGEFVSFEADVWIDPSKANASVGIFAGREKARANDTETIAEAAVLRHKEGNVQLRFVRQGVAPEERDMQQPFPTGRWVRVKLERRGDSSEGTVTLYLDGIPLVENLPMPALAQAKTGLLVGLFAEGVNGREIVVRMDNVSVVTRGS